jgi:hypothetical protein
VVLHDTASSHRSSVRTVIYESPCWAYLLSLTTVIGLPDEGLVETPDGFELFGQFGMQIGGHHDPPGSVDEFAMGHAHLEYGSLATFLGTH